MSGAPEGADSALFQRPPCAFMRPKTPVAGLEVVRLRQVGGATHGATPGPRQRLLTPAGSVRNP